MEGWRDGSVVKNTACLCRGVELSSQHHTQVFSRCSIREDIVGEVAIESDLEERVGIQNRFYTGAQWPG